VPTVEVNGTSLYYEIVGDGIPCIALHGGPGLDHTYFKASFGPLEDDLRFIYVDQRGNGRSDRPPLETITLPQLAADADVLRERLGYEEIAMLGHSFGGFVALEYATSYPDRLSHLLLIDTSPGDFEPTPDELAERPDPSTVSPEAVEATHRLFSTMPSSNEELAQRLPGLARAYVHRTDPKELSSVLANTILDANTMMRGFQAFAGWSVVDKLDLVTCPTLVLFGRYDLQTTPECAKRLSTAIPHAELVWFENSGHFPWLEEPDAFFGAVKDWLARSR
jgi:proline iminopeptidase